MKFEFSAGGVVFKKDSSPAKAGSGQDGVFILVAQHSQHHGWVFPKGLIGDKEHLKGEKKEDTAVREVKEETGIDAQILEPLTPVVYWYKFDGQMIKKTVYYFVMKYLGGDSEKRDMEMEAVEWITPAEVENKLTYKSDKEVWRQAQEIIERFATSG